MATGLLALLDDVAAIAKSAAASIDDIAVQSMKAGSKAAGIVIDDTAVTPRYVVGFAAARELPIIGRIAVGSLKNKLLILLPGALILSAIAPWAITPLLIAGGLYLCFEGYEKLHSMIMPHEALETVATEPAPVQTPEEHEAEMVGGAIRTDFILSAEIMAITLSTVADQALAMRAVVLAAVGLFITFLVYGLVALIVKADDAGAALVRFGKPGAKQLGLLLVKGMPYFLAALSLVGTLAMLWVGGDIVLHGLAGYGFDAPERWIKDTAAAWGSAMPLLPAAFSWLFGAIGLGIAGTILGALTVPIVAYVIKPLSNLARASGRGGA